jgi:hypothetical protein
VKDIASFIDVTDTKIKDVKRESTTIKAQALSATVASKENAENIRVLQEMLANVDLSSLAGQVLENTANINILDRRVTVAILDEDSDQPEQASFMYRLRPNEELEQEDEDNTIVISIDGRDDVITYVVNDESKVSASTIEDAIIVEEIIDGEIVYCMEDDTQQIINADGEEDARVVVDEENITYVKATDDNQDTIVTSEDDGQTTITNC